MKGNTHAPCLRTCVASPIIHLPHQMVHLWQLRSLHWHITMTQSPQFTSWLILLVVQSMDLDKGIMTWIYFYGKNSLCSTNSFLPSSPTCSHWFFFFTVSNFVLKITIKYHIKLNDRKKNFFTSPILFRMWFIHLPTVDKQPLIHIASFSQLLLLRSWVYS